MDIHSEINGATTQLEEPPTVSVISIAVPSDSVEAYSERLHKHIKLVRFFGKILGTEINNHDNHKFDTSEFACHASSYNNRKNGCFLTDAEHEVLFNHIRREPHHPEAHDPNFTKDLYFKNCNYTPNDSDYYCVDARGMSTIDLCEMVCDWCAVSIEMESDPQDWFVEHEGKRWTWSTSQRDLIIDMLDALWTPENVEEAWNVWETGRIDECWRPTF